MKKIRILNEAGEKKEVLQEGEFLLEQRDGETLVLNCDTGVWKIDSCYNALVERIEGDSIDIFTGDAICNQLLKDELMNNIQEEVRNEKFKLLILETSEKCNMRCKYCFEDANISGKNMSCETARKAFQKFISLDECAESICVEFNGGEALLNFEMIREVVPQMLQIADEKRLKISFTIQTNGTLLNGEMVDFFKKYNFSVGLSLDGVGDYNEKRTYPDGSSTFNDVIKGIRLLQRKGVPYSTISVIHRKGQLYSVVDLIDHTGCKEFRANLLSSLGRGKKAMEEILDDLKNMAEEYVAFCKKLLRERHYYEANTMYYFLALLLMHPFMCYKKPCGAGRNQLFVTPDGDIFLCQESCFIQRGCVGNIELDKNDIIKNIKRDNWFLEIENRRSSLLEECNTCAWRKFCCPCPCRVYEETEGTFQTSVLCEFYKYILREFVWIIHSDTEAVMNFLQYSF